MYGGNMTATISRAHLLSEKALETRLFASVASPSILRGAYPTRHYSQTDSRMGARHPSPKRRQCVEGSGAIASSKEVRHQNR